MRIVTWNCNNGNFKAKLDQITKTFEPDIAVITEAFQSEVTLPNVHWKSDCKTPGRPNSRTRGIAVYIGNGFSLSPLVNKPLHRCVHGYRISGPTTFNLLACWAHKEYRDNWVDGIAAHNPFLDGQPLVVAGDLNDNSEWDEDYPGDPTFEARFSDLRAKYKIVSGYHQFFEEKCGEESHPTFFQKRKEVWMPYHDDYVLVPQAWRITEVLVGKKNEWPSDHVPVLITLDT